MANRLFLTLGLIGAAAVSDAQPAQSRSTINGRPTFRSSHSMTCGSYLRIDLTALRFSANLAPQ
jgi:hypothetical protein